MAAAVAERKRAFEKMYKKLKKFEAFGKEMRPVKGLLLEMTSRAAKRARPSVGERMGPWSRRFRWPAKSYKQLDQARSPGGGGRAGYVATKGALEDIYGLLA